MSMSSTSVGNFSNNSQFESSVYNDSFFDQSNRTAGSAVEKPKSVGNYEKGSVSKQIQKTTAPYFNVFSRNNPWNFVIIPTVAFSHKEPQEKAAVDLELASQ